MINQTLMIAIGFTCVATILLFLYFKRKITSIEYKLDSLFTLIEQHTQEKNRMGSSQRQQNMMTEEQQVNIGDESKIINLIPVSDNEIETDSEEEFTTEEEESEREESEEESEYVNLEESELKEIHLEDSNKEQEVVGQDQELEEIAEDEVTHVTKLDDYETLKIVDNDRTNILGVDILNYGGDLEELEELESDFEETDSIDLEGSSKKVIQVEVIEELQKELQYVNLQKLKVPTLREIADKYNLHENSKKLKKNQLIQLLEKHK